MVIFNQGYCTVLNFFFRLRYYEYPKKGITEVSFEAGRASFKSLVKLMIIWGGGAN